MKGLRQRFKELSIIRLIGLFFGLLIALGRWEAQHLGGRRRQRRQRPALTFNWLVGLGWAVERLVLKLLGGPRRLLGFLWRVFRLIIWPLIWLSGALTVLVKGLKSFITAAPVKTKVLLKDKAKEAVAKLKPKPRLVFWRPVAAFACLLMILILPLKFYGNWQALNSLKNQIMTTAKAAINDAFSAKQSIEQKDFNEANKKFSQASANFLAADAELKKVNGFLLTLAGLLPNSQAHLAASGEAILAAGNLGSGIAADLSQAMDSLFGQSANKDVVSALAGFTEHATAAKTKAEELSRVLDKINAKDLPEEYQEEFIYFKDRVKFLAANLDELTAMSDNLRIFLGEAYDKRYLLVFQNNTEARASGGFMGSFAVADFSRGKLKSLKVPGGGTYDTEAGLQHLIQSPKPLQLVRARWYLWDANWWPDWPTSARKVMWFYEQSDGSTVDGVISLTPEVIIRLLEVVGPVKLDGEFNTTITADNFMDVVQTFAEQNNETNTPKQIIGALTDKLLAKITAAPSQELWLKIVGIIEKALNEKQLLLYFSDQSLESKVSELGWDGRLKETNGDYLAVINTNINGGKSDRVIKQTVELTTNVLSDGSLVNHLKIIRDHQGKAGEGFSGFRNNDWLRVYVPLGSQLIEAEGFQSPDKSKFKPVDANWEQDKDLLNEREAEVSEGSGTLTYREQDKTVFANWSMVEPGQMAVIKLSYKLPFKLEAKTADKNWLDKLRDVFAANTDAPLYRHSLLVQKQAGAVNSEINYKFEVPSFYEKVWQYPESNSQADYQAQDTDKYWGYILKAKN